VGGSQYSGWAWIESRNYSKLNYLNFNQTDMKACEHKRTYVAVRHVSGLTLRKCRDCGKTV
jgi:hypothetical protein